jgi:hypothetical protein
MPRPIRAIRPRAGAPATNPDGRRALDMSLGVRAWRGWAGATGARSRFRQPSCRFLLFGNDHQGYSTYETWVDGLPIWGMSFCILSTSRWPRARVLAFAEGLTATVASIVTVRSHRLMGDKG